MCNNLFRLLKAQQILSILSASVLEQVQDLALERSLAMNGSLGTQAGATDNAFGRKDERCFSYQI
jgi:hypothetical protein